MVFSSAFANVVRREAAVSLDEDAGVWAAARCRVGPLTGSLTVRTGSVWSRRCPSISAVRFRGIVPASASVTREAMRSHRLWNRPRFPTPGGASPLGAGGCRRGGSRAPVDGLEHAVRRRVVELHGLHHNHVVERSPLIVGCSMGRYRGAAHHGR